MLPPVRIESRTSHFKSKTLLSELTWHFVHVVLVLADSSKSKNQVKHEQKFKDSLSITCQVSSEERALDLKSVGPGFNPHWE